LHFWAGSETPQTIIDALTIKITELHLYVGYTPIIYREIEGFESYVFMTYFEATGIEYLPLEDSPTNEPRFFHVKGKREKRVKEISKSVSYLSDTDAFVLDAVDKIFVYAGKKCSRYDFRHAMTLAEEIKSSDRSPDCAIVQVDNTPVVYGSFLEAEKQYRGDSHLLAEFKSILKEV
jgi:hypothetical protein